MCHQGQDHWRLRPLLQPDVDERRDVPGVPQHWTVQASRHVHWSKHPTDAIADAITVSITDNAVADHALANHAVSDAVTDTIPVSKPNVVTDYLPNAVERSLHL